MRMNLSIFQMQSTAISMKYYIRVGAFMKPQLSFCPSPGYYPDFSLVFNLWWLSDGSSPPGPQGGPCHLFILTLKGRVSLLG